MTKKYLIIGNPVSHSLSPQIHNYWFNQNKIDSVYEKKELNEKELPDIVKNIRDGEISGINVTVPFKQKIIPFLDKLSKLSKKTQSVNTIYLRDNEVIGDNTDVYGFVKSIKDTGIELKDKVALIVGAGGVVPSIICALQELLLKKIYLTNRTFKKAEQLKEKYPKLEITKWDELVDFDIIINATSVGLKVEDKIDLNLKKLDGKKFFYDTIYNPPTTDFLNKAKINGHLSMNGKLMLIYQAQKSFEFWNGFLPEVDEKFLNLFQND